MTPWNKVLSPNLLKTTRRIHRLANPPKRAKMLLQWLYSLTSSGFYDLRLATDHFAGKERRQRIEFIAYQAKKALLFPFKVIIACFAITVITVVTMNIGFILYPILGIGVLVQGIIAGLKANDGIVDILARYD